MERKFKNDPRNFMFVCKPHIVRQTTRIKQPIDVETRVVVTIWWLGTNIEYRSLAVLFGLGRSTVGELINDTCFIACHLMYLCVRVPLEKSPGCNRWVRKSLWVSSSCAIDVPHIPILKAQHSASDYYNRKGYYSIIIQAVVGC